MNVMQNFKQLLDDKYYIYITQFKIIFLLYEVYLKKAKKF